MLFDDSNVDTKNRTSNKEILKGEVANSLYQVKIEENKVAKVNLGERVSLTIWHHRLSHNESKMRIFQIVSTSNTS